MGDKGLRMIIDNTCDLHSSYPPLSIWKDFSSFKEGDGKYDYYMMFDKWKFIGRFDSFIEAMSAAIRIRYVQTRKNRRSRYHLRKAISGL
jgi:hypothetical protein